MEEYARLPEQPSDSEGEWPEGETRHESTENAESQVAPCPSEGGGRASAKFNVNNADPQKGQVQQQHKGRQ